MVPMVVPIQLVWALRSVPLVWEYQRDLRDQLVWVNYAMDEVVEWVLRNIEETTEMWAVELLFAAKRGAETWWKGERYVDGMQD